MKKMSKVMAAVAAVSSILMLASCGGKKEVTVRYLNFKPEVANVYQELAAFANKVHNYIKDAQIIHLRKQPS